MDSVLEYEDMIYKMIGRYRNFDKEDLYQVAMLGLMNAKKIIIQMKIQSFQLMLIIIF